MITKTSCGFYKYLNGQYLKISIIYECVEKLSMIIGCNISMICLDLNLYFLWSGLNAVTFWICMDAKFFGISRFNNFHLIGATYTSKISSDQKRLFFANNPFKKWLLDSHPSNPCVIKNQWDILIFLSEIDNLMSSTLLVRYRFKGYHCK